MKLNKGKVCEKIKKMKIQDWQLVARLIEDEFNIIIEGENAKYYAYYKDEIPYYEGEKGLVAQSLNEDAINKLLTGNMWHVEYETATIIAVAITKKKERGGLEFIRDEILEAIENDDLF